MRLFRFTLALLVATSSTALRAETHRFVPTVFFNTYSFAHPPVLRIKSGDRVVTKTIDAAGVDWNGKTVGAGPNPQTGPFFVEGAEAGDMLVVTLEKLETNRAMAYSGSLLAPTVDPAAIAAASIATRRDVDDRQARGVARLDGRMYSLAASSCRVHARRRRRRHGSNLTALRRVRLTWTT